MPRVLVVYGTETGSAKNAINKIASSLASKSGEVQIVDTLCGNSVPDLESLPEKYDMLLVSTSSVRRATHTRRARAYDQLPAAR